MQLIPNEMNPDTKSEAERLIFDKLKTCNMKGIAIHSQELSNHVEKLYSEIDFVVITERGVLCLEVKGGDVQLNKGVWEYINRNGQIFEKSESPFNQARTNKETLLQYVNETYRKANGSEIKRCIYGYGVVMPDTTFNIEAAGVDRNLVFDLSSGNFIDYIIQLYDYWEERLCERLDRNHMQRLSVSHISLLSELLTGRSVSNHTKVIGKSFVDTDQKLMKMSESQYKIFKFGMQNRRLLIEGGAGTGKTLIAIKYAIEKAKTGNRVLFICFNKLLAKWANESIARQGEGGLNIKVINFHDYLLEITNLEVPENRSELNDFYHVILPNVFFDYVAGYEPFDTLIVDEGQDLFYENYLLCLDQFVTGGLSNGNWVMMYDENQNIYLKDAFISGLKEVKSYQPFIGQLDENYRNTIQINEANEELTHIASKACSGIDGEDVEISTYENNVHAQKILKSIMKKIRRNGIEPRDVVILSPHRFENSVLEGNKDLVIGFGPIATMQDRNGKIIEVADDSIKYSTIYSFKGLESHVVIIIGVEKDDDYYCRLYYTGISRAKSKLYVLKKV